MVKPYHILASLTKKGQQQILVCSRYYLVNIQLCGMCSFKPTTSLQVSDPRSFVPLIFYESQCKSDDYWGGAIFNPIVIILSFFF